MNCMNNFQLCGRVVKDAEMGTTSKGKSILRFSIAVERDEKNMNGEYEKTAHFFPVAIFDTFADKLSPYIIKGKQIIVEGHLKQNKWEKEGKKYSSIGIVAEKIHLLGNSISNPKENEYEYEDDSETMNDDNTIQIITE